MREADVVLVALPQADGRSKPQPALLLRRLPPFQDWLVCGISTQLRQEARGFDELLTAADVDFKDSGLRADSLIRLGFLAVMPSQQIIGALGKIAADRHHRLLQKLSDFLRP